MIYEFYSGHSLVLEPNSFFPVGCEPEVGPQQRGHLFQANDVCGKPSPGNSSQWGRRMPAWRGGVLPAASAWLASFDLTTVQFPRPKPHCCCLHRRELAFLDTDPAVDINLFSPSHHLSLSFYLSHDKVWFRLRM